MASLFVIRGRDQGRHVIVPDSGLTLGRDRQCSMQLQDSEVSRQHAVVEPSAGDPTAWQIRDLDSSNGTFVNGHRIQTHRLSSGDRLQIGRSLLVYTSSKPWEVVSPAPARDEGVDIVAVATGDADGSRIVSSLPPPIATADAGGSGASSDEAEPLRRVDRPLELLVEVALAVGRTLEIPELLERVLQLVFDWVGADRGCVMLLDHDTGELHPAARRDRRGVAAAGRMSISRTILDFVVQRREAVRTSNAGSDERFDAAASILRAGVREALCVPLQGRYGVVGALYVDTFTSSGKFVEQGFRGRFNDDQLRLLVAIGHQAALAIEDTFYYSSLVQSERLAAVGQTIATLSHHIKNILQGLRGGGYLVTAGLERHDEAAIQRGWQIVERNQERIGHLVLDMLTLSKERQPEPTRGDVGAMLEDVVVLATSSADETGVTLSLTHPADRPLVWFDAEAMHRAILNLVLNAIDAVATDFDESADAEPSDGPPDDHAESGQTVDRRSIEQRVDLRWGYDPKTQLAWIEVRDTGPGIAPADQEKVFTLFASRKGARGTGLGLPVSRKIVREHGGEILLTSQLGAGSCFRAQWPAGGSGGETQPG